MSNVPPPVKKNNKKKKKKKTVQPDLPSTSPPQNCCDSTLCQNDANKENFSITEILPNRVGMKAFFNDVEVIMTSDGKEVKDVAAKKKKKKKKAKQQPELQQTQVATESAIDSSESYFKFSENHIELLNHPEISVTITKPKIQEQIVELTETKKSKKKKKKQQQQQQAELQNNQKQSNTVTQNNQKQTNSVTPKNNNTANQNNQKQTNTVTQNNQKKTNTVTQNNQKKTNTVTQNNQKQTNTVTQNNQKQTNTVTQNKPNTVTQNNKKQTNTGSQNRGNTTAQNSQKLHNSASQTTSATQKQSPTTQIVQRETKQSQSTSESASGETKKKRNRKKKKKKAVDPVEVTPNTPEATTDAPTYVKLPGAGDNFVLLVSHQSFVNNTPPSTGDPDSSKTILIQSKERKEQLKNCGVTLTPIVEPLSMSMPSSVIAAANPVKVTDNLINNPVTVPANPINNSVTVAVTPISNPVTVAANPITVATNSITVGANCTLDNSNTQTMVETVGESVETKSKAQLKAERRAVQEAQRAAKLAKSSGTEQANAAKVPKKAGKEQAAAEPKPKGGNTEDAVKTTVKQAIEKDTAKVVGPSKPSHEASRKKSHPFSHLRPFEDVFGKPVDASLHPAVLEMGSHLSKGILSGSNARCVAFLAAFQDVVRDYDPIDSVTEVGRQLEGLLQGCLAFLGSCRPLSASILSAVDFLKKRISHLPAGCGHEQAKQAVLSSIQSFVQEELVLADEAISLSTCAKIVEGDNILVHAHSSVVRDVLLRAHEQGKRFTVTVVNIKPRNEGLTMLSQLSSRGIRCVLTVPAAVSYCMSGVSKVIVGTHALLSNGCVTSRLGYKQIAAQAAAFSIPVIVCCETYKFCERAVTDSFAHNELGDPACLTPLDKPTLAAYNVQYDVTPMDLIAAVHTEKGILPCTSVPVVLRVKHAQE